MERALRTLEIDGHTVEVIEMVDDDGEWIVLAVEGTVINEDEPLPTDAEDDDIRVAFQRWAVRE